MSVLHSVREKHPAYGYALRRILALIPVLLGVTFLTYGLMYLSPQDPVEMMLQGQGTAPAPEVVEAMRHQLGLDRPFLVQSVDWLSHFVRGDMGVSYLDGAPVAGKLLSALPNTLKLTAASVLVTVLFSVPLGVLTAVKQGKPADIIIRFLSFIGNSLPNYIVSLLLLYVLALKLGWFPTGGKGGISSLVLPAVTVGFGLAALITRTTRSSMLDVLRQDYMTTARAKGCSEKQVITVHGLKNALIPIITAIGLQMSLVITGSVLAETVFSWPGIGRLVYDSISNRDTPMVTGAIIMCSILMCIINLVVDLIYAFFDPRIKAQYSKKG